MRMCSVLCLTMQNNQNARAGNIRRLLENADADRSFADGPVGHAVNVFFVRFLNKSK
jgi:hypothetical protein